MAGRLRAAATGGEVMRIDHTSIASGTRTVREIEPWSVFTTLGNWYVAGHCRRAGAERVFRIDRIRDLVATGETFAPRDEEREPEIRYSAGDDDVAATIRLTTSAGWVAEYYPVEILDSEPAGWTIRISVGDAAVAARLLVRLGRSAELLEGDEVAAATSDLRSRIRTRYARDGRSD